MRRVIEDMTKRGTVWMMALMFAASLLAAPAAMAHKAGVQAPQKGDRGVLGFGGHRKIFFKIQEDGGGGYVAPVGSNSSTRNTVAGRHVVEDMLRLYVQFVVRR